MLRKLTTLQQVLCATVFHMLRRRRPALWAVACMMALASADAYAGQPRRSFLARVIESFSEVDTNYIEPQHYNFALMLQNTNNYELYRLSNDKGQSILFAPQWSVKLGPYFGWRWIFLGYTLDVNHLSNSKRKKEFDISLYSSRFGIDLFYRKTGNDYLIRSMYLGKDVDTKPLRHTAFSGLNSSVKGFNLYYIFNNKHFSYPAAFSQSTVQRRSCGSVLLGIGYTKHSLNVDWDRLEGIIKEKLPANTEAVIDSSMKGGNVRYTDISVSGGYAYNWVFARNWLFAASLSAAVGYKSSNSRTEHTKWSIKDFDFKNFNIDGIGRFGLVWNNTKWFAGVSAILHSYNYHKDQFSTNTAFGNVNIYAGFNFGKRKHQ